MKTCPNCNQAFGDENDFCLEDGTRLAVPGGPGFNTDYRPEEVPTQYIPGPRTTQNAAASTSSAWVYPVIGVLFGLVVVLGFFAFFNGSSNDVNSVTQKNTAVAEPNKSVENRPRQGDPPPVTPAPVAIPVLPSNQASNIVTVNSPRDGYLALKEEPCTMPCRTLIKIPHSTRLSLGTCREAFEVADRRQGRWCYTTYGGYSGWVFDAFVTR